jgi:phage major head subunit gpT-like protein
MAGIIISEASAKNDMLYGKWQAPIASFLETRAEAIDQGSIAAKIFKKVNSTHWAESYGSLTAIDDFKPTPENGAYPISGFEQGYSKIIKNFTWKNSFAISREMLEDGNLINLRKQPAGFMTSYERTRERYFAALLGGALQGMKKVKFGGEEFDIAGADEEAIFSKNHKGKVSKKTIVNAFADEFNATNLGKAATAMQNMKGDNDETLGLVPDTILIPNIESIKSKVWTAIGSEKVPGSSNNDYNYQFGNWNVIIWPYLNDFIGNQQEPWILMDSNYMQEADVAIWQDRVPLEIKSVVDENDANRWKGRARFGGGFVDFRGMVAGGVAMGGAL